MQKVWSSRLLRNTVWDPAWTSSPTRERPATSPSPSCLGELQHASLFQRWTRLLHNFMHHVAKSLNSRHYALKIKKWWCVEMLFKSTVRAPCLIVLPIDFCMNSDVGHMLEMTEQARMCPLAPGVTRKPSWNMSSSTLWAFTTNSLAPIEMTTSISGGTRLKKVSHSQCLINFTILKFIYWLNS